MSIQPKSRPRLSAQTVLETAERLLVNDRGSNGGAILADCPVMVLGIRGYYRDTMGKPRVNDFGIYDDAGFLIVAEDVLAFNWNCDPVRVGFNPGVDKVFAQLSPGVWPFRRGPHRGRPGHLRQLTPSESGGLGTYFHDQRRIGNFLVRRVATAEQFTTEWDYQAINMHEGTSRGTGSWGCQTLPPEQWPEFSKRVYAAMDKYKQTWIPYVLTEERVS